MRHAAAAAPAALVLVLPALAGFARVTADEAAPGVPGLSRPAPRVSGIARASRRADVAVPFDGVVATVSVSEGDMVEAGDELARMDDRVAIASVAAARAAADRTGPIAYAEAEVRLYETRLALLEQAGSATEFEVAESRIRLEQAEANLRTAEEDRTQSRRNLALELARLELHQLRAPIDGRVVRVLIRDGEAGERREPVIVMADPTTLDVEMHLSVEAWSGLEPGAWYRLDAGAPVDRPVSARLRTADPIIESATRTVRCVFEIPNPGLRMPVGIDITAPAAGPAPASPPDLTRSAQAAGSPSPGG